MGAFCQVLSQNNLDNDNLIHSNWQTDYPISICWMKNTSIIHSAGEAHAIGNVSEFDTARGKTRPILKTHNTHFRTNRVLTSQQCRSKDGNRHERKGY
jgi:hypothetical protein